MSPNLWFNVVHIVSKTTSKILSMKYTKIAFSPKEYGKPYFIIFVMGNYHAYILD